MKYDQQARVLADSVKRLVAKHTGKPMTNPRQPRSVGIAIHGCSRGQIISPKTRNLDTHIEVSNSDEIEISNPDAANDPEYGRRHGGDPDRKPRKLFFGWRPSKSDIASGLIVGFILLGAGRAFGLT